MTIEDESLKALQEAVKLSPDNLPLRKHFAASLTARGLFVEAEKEYLAALALSPDDSELKYELASVFYQLGKYGQSLVIVEDLAGGRSPHARALVLHARLLLNDGKGDQAAEKYRQALSIDRSVTDESLAEQLGVSAREMIKESYVENRERLAVKSSGDEEPDCLVDLERPSIAFKDVGGMEDIKEQVRMKIIHPLNNPDIYKAYGKQIGGGILMYGPPGCGKTHLARATAGEIKAGFISVGINDVLDMWLGNSEKNLHEIFEQARRNSPCVLFFDEVDALAASRADLRTSGGKQVINQFLSELDGVETSNEGVLVLAATNAPWHLDSAFRRPGRFDRIIFVPPPDKDARVSILRIMTTGKPVDKIDFELLAKRSEKFSGADLKNLIDVAIEAKLESALKTGVPEPLTTKDLEKAMKVVKPSTLEWFSTARNYAMYANQGGAYDDILKYLK